MPVGLDKKSAYQTMRIERMNKRWHGKRAVRVEETKKGKGKKGKKDKKKKGKKGKK